MQAWLSLARHGQARKGLDGSCMAKRGTVGHSDEADYLSFDNLTVNYAGLNACAHRERWYLKPRMKKNGELRIRWKCKACRQRFTEGSDRHAKRLIALQALLNTPGMTVLDLRKRGLFGTGIYRWLPLVAASLPRCPCGRPALHISTCSWRKARAQLCMPPLSQR